MVIKEGSFCYDKLGVMMLKMIVLRIVIGENSLIHVSKMDLLNQPHYNKLGMFMRKMIIIKKKKKKKNSDARAINICVDITDLMVIQQQQQRKKGNRQTDDEEEQFLISIQV